MAHGPPPLPPSDGSCSRLPPRPSAQIRLKTSSLILRTWTVIIPKVYSFSPRCAYGQTMHFSYSNFMKFKKKRIVVVTLCNRRLITLCNNIPVPYPLASPSLLSVFWMSLENIYSHFHLNSILSCLLWYHCCVTIIIKNIFLNIYLCIYTDLYFSCTYRQHNGMLNYCMQ